MTIVSVTLPWPPKVLSPNFRTRSFRRVAIAKRDYRRACAEAAWLGGIRPTDTNRLAGIVFHAPDARRRDDDNIIASFKAGRDGLAEVIGVDDSAFNNTLKRFGTPVPGGAVVVMIEIPG